MTAATDLATAKTQADTVKTATATLKTNTATALASAIAEGESLVSSNYARSAAAIAAALDLLANQVVYNTNVSRSTTAPG